MIMEISQQPSPPTPTSEKPIPQSVPSINYKSKASSAGSNGYFYANRGKRELSGKQIKYMTMMRKKDFIMKKIDDEMQYCLQKTVRV